MNQFEQFQAALVLSKVSDNIFSFTPASRYFVGNTPHGGYLLALMNKAMTQVLPHPSAINSNVYYLDRTEPESAELHVEVFRTSKGSSMGQVKLIQNNKITCLYSALCSDFDYMKGYSGLNTSLPEIMKTVKQNDFKVMNYENLGLGSTPSFIKQLNMSVHPDHAWWDRDISSDAAEARCSAYLELEGGIADTFVLSYLADIYYFHF